MARVSSTVLALDAYILHHSSHAFKVMVLAGSSSHVIVIFMHNVVSGHETRRFRAVGPNNTDPGCWSTFTDQCLLVTDMTFDETTFTWNEINQNAMKLVAEAISSTAAKQSSSQPPIHETFSQDQTAGRSQHARPDTPHNWPVRHDSASDVASPPTRQQRRH